MNAYAILRAIFYITGIRQAYNSINWTFDLHSETPYHNFGYPHFPESNLSLAPDCCGNGQQAGMTL